MGAGSKNTLYPRRQRCYKCRKFFGPLVVKGLYCSFDCAGMPPPSVQGASRSCQENGHGTAKKRWDIAEEAKDFARKARLCGDEGLEAYECAVCGGWHVGHPPGYRKRKKMQERRERLEIKYGDLAPRADAVPVHDEAVESVRDDAAQERPADAGLEGPL